MSIRAGYSTPMLHVANVSRSIRFYRHLGFEPIDVQGQPACPVWARMHCEGGAIMFLASEHPVDARAESILLYLYTEDLPGLREQLVAAGCPLATEASFGYGRARD